MLLEYMFSLIGCCLFTLVPATSTNPSTTKNIKDIFIGRCWEYFEIRPKLPIVQSVTNCTEIWSLFSEAWIHKDPTTVKEADYFFFFTAVKQMNIEKILFWSGTFDIAHEYSRHVSYYVTLEDSFLGYLVNGLTWCGMVCSNCSGINYSACPDNLHNNATSVFWGGASRTFASSLKKNGSVQVMLNGSNPHKPAFNPDSFFSKFELPNLPKSANISVILVHDIGKAAIETCTNGSLIELKNRLQMFGFKFDCHENPAAVVHLLCADIPQSTECSLPSVNMPTTPALLPVRRSFRHPGVKMKWSHFQTKGGLSRLLDAPGKASTKYGSIESILSTKKKHRLNHGEAIAKGFGPYHLALPLR